ncbi:MAG: SMC-Scp complex subunit ScpB [Nitrososphaerota archaeon]|nr:SMC-Scp complex subunit ScpB [Nitrososphaerota archaeon]
MSTQNVGAEQKSADILENDERATLSKEAQARIEVALYASGRPLSLDELAKVARIGSRRRLAELMSELSRKINTTFSAIELREIDGPGYSLQLKPNYNSIAKKFATKPLLSGAVLKTLSYVVYLQPVSTQELVQRRGSQVYSHLKQLIEVRFLSSERRGRSRVFRTTELFADYFGLSQDPELQRKQVAKQGLIDKARQIERPAAQPQ